MERTQYSKLLETAIAEARRGLAEGGIPIGAALFDGSGKLLGSGHNRRVQDGDPSAHGETDAFRKAGRQRHYRADRAHAGEGEAAERGRRRRHDRLVTQAARDLIAADREHHAGGEPDEAVEQAVGQPSAQEHGNAAEPRREPGKEASEEALLVG